MHFHAYKSLFGLKDQSLKHKYSTEEVESLYYCVISRLNSIYFVVVVKLNQRTWGP